MKTVAILPGRFHPVHKGHANSFKQLASKFGIDNTYFAISEKQEMPKSPFPAEARKKMALLLGIPEKNILIVKNPYSAQEYQTRLNLDPNNTILVFGVAQKDMETDPRFSFNPLKNGSKGYMQPFKQPFEPMSKHAYVLSTATQQFPIAGKNLQDASAIRNLYASGNEQTRNQVLFDLYGKYGQAAKKLFDTQLHLTEQALNIISQMKPLLNEASDSQKQKIISIVRSIL